MEGMLIKNMKIIYTILIFLLLTGCTQPMGGDLTSKVDIEMEKQLITPVFKKEVDGDTKRSYNHYKKPNGEMGYIIVEIKEENNKLLRRAYDPTGKELDPSRYYDWIIINEDLNPSTATSTAWRLIDEVKDFNIFDLFGLPVYAGTNIASTDLELGSQQFWDITDGDQTGLDLNSDFTFQFWIKPETVTGEHTLISKYGASGNQRAYYMGYVGNTLQLVVSTDGSTFDNMTIGHELIISEWVHITTTLDLSESTVEFFINGSSIGTATGSRTSIKNSTANFFIGAKQSNDAWADGLMDDVQVYSDIRTDTEISDYYADPCSMTTSEGNLVGWWKFDDNGLDETTNNNDLTNNNSATFGEVAFECVEPAGGTATLISDF